MSLPILDVAIGIIFVYLLLALICTTLNEMIAGWRRSRAHFLDLGITRLLGNDEKLKDALYAHPLIRSLSSSEEVGPSYIPADKFATALMETLSAEGKTLSDVDAVRKAAAAAARHANVGATTEGKGADKGEDQGEGKRGRKRKGKPAAGAGTPAGAEAPTERFAKALSAVVKQGDGEATAEREAIEKWFNDGMDRVSGWYKRHAQFWVPILACAITLVLNADTLRIANILWVNPAVRAALVEEAKVRSQKARPEELLPLVEYPDPQDPTASKPVDVPAGQALSDHEQALLGQLTGWSEDWKSWRGNPFYWLGNVIWTHALGWILTAIAVSMGAPFWFDLLNRFMNVRNAGRAPDERQDKSRSAKTQVVSAKVSS